jgi:hypothetical protein
MPGGRCSALWDCPGLANGAILAVLGRADFVISIATLGHPETSSWTRVTGP